MEKRRAQLILAGLAVAVVAGPGAWQGLRMSWQQRVLAKKQQRLDALYKALEEERRRLISDPGYVEGLIRSTFKVAKPNEIVLPSDGDSSRRDSSRR